MAMPLAIPATPSPFRLGSDIKDLGCPISPSCREKWLSRDERTRTVVGHSIRIRFAVAVPNAVVGADAERLRVAGDVAVVLANPVSPVDSRLKDLRAKTTKKTLSDNRKPTS